MSSNIPQATAQLIDTAQWPRAEHFEHYLNASPCSYSMTVEVEVTELVFTLHDSRFKTYPTQIWALAHAVNKHPESRMTLGPQRQPAIWPVVHPVFTIFNEATQSFCAVPVQYDDDFTRFHDRALELLNEHRRSTRFFPLGATPVNSFDVSSIPWASFTGFNLNIPKAQDHLAPIITLGRYVERGERIFLPVALQAHHAAMDGFHSARLLNDFAELCAQPQWLNVNG